MSSPLRPHTTEVPRRPGRRAASLAAATLAAALTVAGIAGPVTHAAADAASDARAKRDEVLRQRADAAAELDATQASLAELNDALAALDAQATQAAADAAAAQDALAAATAAAAAARTAEAAKAAEVTALEDAVRRMVVNAYMGTKREDPDVVVLRTEDLNEAVRARAYLNMKAERDNTLIDQLAAARDQLTAARIDAENAEAAATTAATDAAALVASVEATRAQQQALAAASFARAIELADQTAELDASAAALSAEIIKATTPPPPPPAPAVGGGGGGAVPGGIVSVRGILIHSSAASSLAAMLDAAAADGVALGGYGWRDSSEQIRLRIANGCPDVYTAPPSSCAIPTALPGTSMHEIGLAVDFTYGGASISSRANPGFAWLAANAARYGWYNLPSEPWHWSVSGR